MRIYFRFTGFAAVGLGTLVFLNGTCTYNLIPSLATQSIIVGGIAALIGGAILFFDYVIKTDPDEKTNPRKKSKKGAKK